MLEAKQFGQNLGIMFQIRDDIFDYYDSKEIGKPTGNDMAEGKLTLPVIYALNNTDFEAMHTLAKKVKAGSINADEIAVLVEFTKQQGGIEYAEQRMQYFSQLCKQYIDSQVKEKAVKDALTAYVDYVVQRNY
jgi:octaprenyl-diphosphate synthase